MNALEADMARMYGRRDLQRLDATHGRVEHMDQSLPWWSARARRSNRCNAYCMLLLLLHRACAMHATAYPQRTHTHIRAKAGHSSAGPAPGSTRRGRDQTITRLAVDRADELADGTLVAVLVHLFVRRECIAAAATYL